MFCKLAPGLGNINILSELLCVSWDVKPSCGPVFNQSVNKSICYLLMWSVL